MELKNRTIPGDQTRRGRFKTVLSVMANDIKGVSSIPASKIVQLYGLDEVARPTRIVTETAERFKKHHSKIGTIVELASWTAISFSLTRIGMAGSDFLRSQGLNGMSSDIIAYLTASVHPSLISMYIRNTVKSGFSKVGMSRYIEAATLSDLIALPVFFTVLGGIIHAGHEATVSAGRAVSAVLASNILAYATWAAGFTAYWAKVVRKEKSEGFIEDAKKFAKGFASSIHFGKAMPPEGAYHEAGAMVGTALFVWGIPWYTVRIGAAILATKTGVSPDMFNAVFFSIVSVVESVSVVLNGVKVSMVEGILKRSEDTR